MLCGSLPFVSKPAPITRIRSNNDRELRFTGSRWQKLSDEAKDFIRKLIVTSKEQRMSAVEALNHSWLKSAKNRQKAELDLVLGNLQSFSVIFLVTNRLNVEFKRP